MTPGRSHNQTLDDVRREIDAIDDGILDLLARRYRVVDRVRELKRQANGRTTSPLRPSREAEVLRRLLQRARELDVNPQLLVRLWPAIFAEASMRQEKLSIRISAGLAADPDLRLMVDQSFPLIPVAVAPSDGDAMKASASDPLSLCIVPVGAPWVASFLPVQTSSFQVMAALPGSSAVACPSLFVLGHCEASPSGMDETVFALPGTLPPAHREMPRWQAASGSHTVVALPGFLSVEDLPLALRNMAGVKILGRYPAPLAPISA